jgi:hypothetical protein
MSGLQWSNQITVGDLLTFTGLFGGLISLVFVFLQVRAGAQQAQLAATAQRGRFLLDVIQRYFDDLEMLRIYSLIDNKRFVYHPDNYFGSADAAAVSRTLYYFDTVGFLVDKGLISLEDVAILRYRIDAFFESDEIKKVLDAYENPRGGRSSLGHAHELARKLHMRMKTL